MCARQQGLFQLPAWVRFLLSGGTVIATIVLACLPLGVAADEAGWIPLFGDKDLEAWDKPAKEWIVAGEPTIAAASASAVQPDRTSGESVSQAWDVRAPSTRMMLATIRTSTRENPRWRPVDIVADCLGSSA